MNHRQFDIQTHRGDIVMNATTGSFATVSGIDELAQKVSHLLNIDFGELRWNRELGINQREILVNANSPSVVNAIVRRYLRNVFGTVFKDCHVYGFVKHRDTRTVDLTMRVTFNNPDGAPVHINLALEVGGD